MFFLDLLFIILLLFNRQNTIYIGEKFAKSSKYIEKITKTNGRYGLALQAEPDNTSSIFRSKQGLLSQNGLLGQSLQIS